MVTRGPATICLAALSFATVFGLASPSLAQALSPKEKAKLMLQRLTSTRFPGDHPLLAEMESRIASGDKVGAARLATGEDGFYNLTVKDFAAKMSTRDETTQAPLSDFVAAIIGVTRDQTDARELLHGDFYYKGDPALTPTVTGLPDVRQNMLADVIKSNNHYNDLSLRNLRQVLRRYDGQQTVNGADAVVAHPEPSGILSSRGWLEAHATAGTNRRLVEFALREFLCIPITDAADATGPDDIVGRDVDRYPGGSNQKFQTSCKSCHTVLDGMRPAFARFDFDGFVRHSGVMPNTGATNNINADGNGIARKYNQNAGVFAGGFTTVNTNWSNYANYGANTEYFGWRGSLTGAGLQQFGVMVSNSQAFSKCMVKRAFRQVCKRSVITGEKSFVAQQAQAFETDGYKLRGLFERVAASRECLGE